MLTPPLTKVHLVHSLHVFEIFFTFSMFKRRQSCKKHQPPGAARSCPSSGVSWHRNFQEVRFCKTRKIEKCGNGFEDCCCLYTHISSDICVCLNLGTFLERWCAVSRQYVGILWRRKYTWFYVHVCYEKITRTETWKKRSIKIYLVLCTRMLRKITRTQTWGKCFPQVQKIPVK